MGALRPLHGGETCVRHGHVFLCGTLRDSSHAHLTKDLPRAVESSRRNQRFASMRMIPAAVRSGEEIPSSDISDAVSRAASLRSESDMLRRRASAVREDVIRDQYLALAERFSMLAASLEMQAMAELIR